MFCPDCGTWNRAQAARCVRCGASLPELPEGPGRADRPDDEVTALRRALGGRYRVQRRLGSGGMAHVYLSVHGLLERSVVIKTLYPHLARDPEMRERFRREAEAASQLVHPHICGIIDYNQVGEIVYLVMPYLSGGSLADVLTKSRVIPPARAASVATQVAVALDYAHRRGVVHRDIKPDNVLFDEDGNAVVTDFGIATARFHSRLTATGRAMGTPHYMSPEQAMGKMIDGRSDLYAVGVMLYELVLGFPPFDGADSYSIGYKHVHETPVAPESVDSRTPAELSAVIMRCLAKNPAERYQRGNDLADALVAFLGGLPAPGESRQARISRRTGATWTPQ